MWQGASLEAFIEKFIQAISEHRYWGRSQKEPMPAGEMSILGMAEVLHLRFFAPCVSQQVYETSQKEKRAIYDTLSY